MDRKMYTYGDDEPSMDLSLVLENENKGEI